MAEICPSHTRGAIAADCRWTALALGVRPCDFFSHLHLDYPAICADKLINDEVDIALVPVVVIPKLENSYIGTLGKTIEPVIRPLGYDWKIGIALITSFAAREVFIGTLATIYSVEADDEDTTTIKQKMASEINPDTGKKRFNFPVGMSLMVFYAFAMQCMATFAIVKRETKTWKWPLIQLFGMALLAYISSFLTYQILS